MEIIPGVGIPVARVGQARVEIEKAVGPPTRSEDRLLLWAEHTPPFGVYVDQQGVAQLVEVYYGEDGADQATFHGVQLTRRSMDDVLADLGRAGMTGRRTEIVAEFDAGFTLWSLWSLTAGDIAPALSADAFAVEDHVVVEGVAIAPAAFWGLR